MYAACTATCAVLAGSWLLLLEACRWPHTRCVSCRYHSCGNGCVRRERATYAGLLAVIPRLLGCGRDSEQTPDGPGKIGPMRPSVAPELAVRGDGILQRGTLSGVTIQEEIGVLRIRGFLHRRSPCGMVGYTESSDMGCPLCCHSSMRSPRASSRSATPIASQQTPG
jgi:hypothetical protein